MVDFPVHPVIRLIAWHTCWLVTLAVYLLTVRDILVYIINKLTPVRGPLFTHEMLISQD